MVLTLEGESDGGVGGGRTEEVDGEKSGFSGVGRDKTCLCIPTKLGC